MEGSAAPASRYDNPPDNPTSGIARCSVASTSGTDAGSGIDASSGIGSGPCGAYGGPTGKPISTRRPVLASAQMSFNPAAGKGNPYLSTDERVIKRQIRQAALHGVTGLTVDWMGPRSEADTGFAELLRCSREYQQQVGSRFVSMIEFDVDVIGVANIKHALDHIVLPRIPDTWWYHGPRLAFQPMLIWWALFCAGVIDWPWRRRINGGGSVERWCDG